MKHAFILGPDSLVAKLFHSSWAAMVTFLSLATRHTILILYGQHVGCTSKMTSTVEPVLLQAFPLSESYMACHFQWWAPKKKRSPIRQLLWLLPQTERLLLFFVLPVCSLQIS
jgi:hypothetical protein